MSMEPALPLCPRCRGAAVVPSRMRNAPEVTVWTCSACSLSWSGLPCESRVCRDGGVLRPVIDRFDNHVNLAVSSADMRAIATARNILPKVIALAKAAGDNVRDDDLDGTNYLSGETRAALDALLRAISVEVKR
jgi:ribosomal protein L37AE/L43A